MTLLEKGYNREANLKRSDKCEQPKTTAIYPNDIIALDRNGVRTVNGN
jgi:hypothetical protein